MKSTLIIFLSLWLYQSCSTPTPTPKWTDTRSLSTEQHCIIEDVEVANGKRINKRTLILRDFQGNVDSELLIDYDHSGNYGPEASFQLKTGKEIKKLERVNVHHHRFPKLKVFGPNDKDEYLLNIENIGVYMLLEKDLPIGMKIFSLMEYQTNQESWMYYGYQQKGLYKNPGDETAILYMDEERHRPKKFTGNTFKDWAEVIIYDISTESFLEPCYSDEMLIEHWSGTSWTGWVKIFDDGGKIISFKTVDAC